MTMLICFHLLVMYFFIVGYLYVLMFLQIRHEIFILLNCLKMLFFEWLTFDLFVLPIDLLQDFKKSLKGFFLWNFVAYIEIICFKLESLSFVEYFGGM